MKRIGWRADKIPVKFRSSSIIPVLGNVRGKRVLIPRALIGNQEIAAKLRAYRAEYGREDEPFGMCCALKDVFDPDGYRRMAELGVTELITVPWFFSGANPDSLEDKCEGIRIFGEKVVAKL